VRLGPRGRLPSAGRPSRPPRSGTFHGGTV
jgi:hypothetical protein